MIIMCSSACVYGDCAFDWCRSDSDEDEDELAADTARKPIPDWAQPAAVLAQLEKQRMMDADKLFGVQMKTINLEEVFKVGSATALGVIGRVAPGVVLD